MAQISKRILNEKTQDRIISLFISSIVLASSKDEAMSFIDDLFTPTEKVMISKRFSIAFMLLEGYDYGTIAQTLKVSTSTICGVSLWLKARGRGLRRIINKIKQHETLGKVWQEIEEGMVDLLTSGKRTAWREGRQLLRQVKTSHEKPF